MHGCIANKLVAILGKSHMRLERPVGILSDHIREVFIHMGGEGRAHIQLLSIDLNLHVIFPIWARTKRRGIENIGSTGRRT